MSEVKPEMFIVASKVKNYIKTTSDMKCSAKVIEILSEKVQQLCDEAIAKAQKDKNKTVLEKHLL
jgi:hypothetical protein